MTRLVDLFLEVAGLEGVSGRERAVADYVLRFLVERGYAPHEQPPPAPGCTAGNVVCEVGGGGNRVLLSHLDTARPSGCSRPRVLSDRICSDGTGVLGVDNRAGVAVLLHLLERLSAEGGASPFTVAFTVCEETTMAGSRSIRLPDCVVEGYVFDSSQRPGAFIHRSYGAQRFSADVKGRAAHAGLSPERGVNAVVAAARAIAHLPLGRIDEHTTANVSTVRAEFETNVVPDRAEFTGEVRSLSAQRVESMVAVIRETVEEKTRAEGAQVSFEAQWDFHPFEVPSDAAVYRRAQRALRRAGLVPRPVISAGGSDANWLNGRGVAAVNFGIGAQNPHGDDEFILIEDLEVAARIAANVVADP